MFNSASLFHSQDFSFSFFLYLCLLIRILKGTWYAGVIRSHQLNKWCRFHVINAKTPIPLGQMDWALSEFLQMPQHKLSLSEGREGIWTISMLLSRWDLTSWAMQDEEAKRGERIEGFLLGWVCQTGRTMYTLALNYLALARTWEKAPQETDLMLLSWYFEICY